ncbi:integrase catalytic domain-containing protein [Trichonephila clavipes]|nr:integrase catalytic domain-containing protein [Trichonephila clavipes]
MACCIAARLAHSVQLTLNITDIETIFWSDSMVTLFWLRDKGEWLVFAANRIKKIKLLFPKSDWRHIPGNMNPDDLISRGCSPSKLIESRWWEGFSWLLEPSHSWPVNELINCESSEILLERKKVVERKSVRKVWNNCIKCRRFKSRSLVAEPSPLPADLVKDAAVFEVNGVDLAGPLYLKRARGSRPRVIYSDNGTNFQGAYNELMAIDWNEVSRYAEIQRISWKFVPPTATWWGGFWEKIIRTLKELLRRTLEDLKDLTPITPAMFLCDRPSSETTNLDMLDGNHLRKRLRFGVKIIKEKRTL